MIRIVSVCLLSLAVTTAAVAQTNGSVAGHVRQRGSNQPIGSADVGLDGRWMAHTDTSGFYRVREVRSGWHLITVRAIAPDARPPAGGAYCDAQ